jgi:competence protein ComGC
MKLTVLDRKGFTLGELLPVLIIVLLVGAVLSPLIRFNRMRMNRVNCARNIRKTGRALYIYALEHDGHFPDSLKALYEEQYLAREELMDCPANRHRGTADDPDYIYHTGLSVRDGSLSPLMEDKPGNHRDGGKNTLLVNGAVTWRQ